MTLTGAQANEKAASAVISRIRPIKARITRVRRDIISRIV
jgi:hypothetical protein